MSETQTLARPSRATEMIRSNARALYPLLSLLLIGLAWQLGVVLFEPAPYLLPSPASVFTVIVAQFETLLYHTGITAFETTLAFLLSIVVAVPLAFAIARYRWCENMVYPLLVMSQAIPKVALAPLVIVWLGFGLGTKVMIGVLVAFFPVVVSTVVGLKSVPQDMVHLGRSMGLSEAEIFRKIYLPASLPSIFGGLKVCITLAVVGAVVGEFVGADRGLGYLILLASGQLQTALMFAALFFLVIIGVVSFALVQWAERALMPWHSSVRQDAA
ncbi:ABC transporter permease [Aquibium sp. A9E412]|uniref:ABC transporter permease n=1 Tax=Aquibium sp. A9E412 TaxID=2976767 RepID=UPI0025AF5556|nr:ABC transporter permease [Aquibium sp. A9E412]MDN2565071.1 ABC transporter permease [Aquibium sp. A9E412]